MKILLGLALLMSSTALLQSSYNSKNKSSEGTSNKASSFKTTDRDDGVAVRMAPSFIDYKATVSTNAAITMHERTYERLIQSLNDKVFSAESSLLFHLLTEQARYWGNAEPTVDHFWASVEHAKVPSGDKYTYDMNKFYKNACASIGTFIITRNVTQTLGSALMVVRKLES